MLYDQLQEELETWLKGGDSESINAGLEGFQLKLRNDLEKNKRFRNVIETLLNYNQLFDAAILATMLKLVKRGRGANSWKSICQNASLGEFFCCVCVCGILFIYIIHNRDKLSRVEDKSTSISFGP